MLVLKSTYVYIGNASTPFKHGRSDNGQQTMSTHQPTSQMIQTTYYNKSKTPRQHATMCHPKKPSPYYGAGTDSCTASYRQISTNIGKPTMTLITGTTHSMLQQIQWNTNQKSFLIKSPPPLQHLSQYHPNLAPTNHSQLSTTTGKLPKWPCQPTHFLMTQSMDTIQEKSIMPPKVLVHIQPTSHFLPYSSQATHIAEPVKMNPSTLCTHPPSNLWNTAQVIPWPCLTPYAIILLFTQTMNCIILTQLPICLPKQPRPHIIPRLHIIPNHQLQHSSVTNHHQSHSTLNKMLKKSYPCKLGHKVMSPSHASNPSNPLFLFTMILQPNQSPPPLIASCPAHWCKGLWKN